MKTIYMDKKQLNEIRDLAEAERRTLGYMGGNPVGNDMPDILDKLGIILLEQPIESEGDIPAFSAVIMCMEENDTELVFLGLNTSDYYDKQIFTIAHELYHYYTKSGSHLSRIEKEESDIIEAKANRFAAEFLLPETALKKIVFNEFKTEYLGNIGKKAILRFIARLHCTWWLPYRSIVRRLCEIGALSLSRSLEFYDIDERDPDGEYYKYGLAVNRDIFNCLNEKTNNKGASPGKIEKIIRNFEDELIDEDKFAETLKLFDKIPDEFGYQVKVDQRDLDELDEFLMSEGDSED